jgi:hypothetical protein
VGCGGGALAAAGLVLGLGHMPQPQATPRSATGGRPPGGGGVQAPSWTWTWTSWRVTWASCRLVLGICLPHRAPSPASRERPLPDLGPVLPPLGSAACRLPVMGPQNFGAPEGDRLLVTCNHPFLASCWFSPAHFVRNYSGSRAAIFTSPLSPAFDLFLYHRPSSSLSLASVFTISDFMELLASGREHGGQRKALRPRLALWNIAGRSYSRRHSAQQPCTMPPRAPVYKIQINGRIFESLVSGNRPCAISCGRRLGLSIWWRVPSGRCRYSAQPPASRKLQETSQRE